MSHFTTLKTKMTDGVFLRKALQDLGQVVQEGPIEASGYLGRKTPVEFKIATPDPEYDIGFRKGPNGYECVADWHGIKHVKQETFVKAMTQRYARHAAEQKLQEQGFTLSSETKEKDGRIHLVLRRMA
jgi:hypothetical protein